LVPEPELVIKNWFESKKEGYVLLKLNVTNKHKNKVTVRVSLKTADESNINVKLPKSFIKDVFLDSDTKTLMHFYKIDPTKDWGQIIPQSESLEVSGYVSAPVQSSSTFTYDYSKNEESSRPIISTGISYIVLFYI
jgi:hypothetical protein